jgi:hypothetical protein
MPVCQFCGKEIEIGEKVYRNDLCPNCEKPLHCCINCELYSEYSHNKCLEPQSEWVPDKEKANFCEFFKISNKRRTFSQQDREKAMKLLDILFKRENEK